jgi:4-hydroxybenzoate polyprenyltransferase
METAVSSRSWPEDLRSWVATRLLRAPVGLLWLILSACMLAASPHGGTTLLAALLIAQFRLWDDLADRDFDARHHPQRVLVASVHGQRFSILCAGVALPILGLLLTWREPWLLVAYGLLCVAMAALYRAGPALPRLLRAHLVLLKYPCFIWLAGAPPLAGLPLWLALALYEIVSDKTLQTSKYWRWLAGVECLAVALSIVIFIEIQRT